MNGVAQFKRGLDKYYQEKYKLHVEPMFIEKSDQEK